MPQTTRGVLPIEQPKNPPPICLAKSRSTPSNDLLRLAIFSSPYCREWREGASTSYCTRRGMHKKTSSVGSAKVVIRGRKEGRCKVWELEKTRLGESVGVRAAKCSGAQVLAGHHNDKQVVSSDPQDTVSKKMNEWHHKPVKMIQG